MLLYNNKSNIKLLVGNRDLNKIKTYPLLQIKLSLN